MSDARLRVIEAYRKRIGASDDYMKMIGLSDTLAILTGDEEMRRLVLELLAAAE